MINLEWDDSYTIGIDFIDQDHKRLLSIMRDLRDSILEGKLKKCASLSNNIIQETEAHFTKEETYLKKIGYPYLEKHKKYHQELLAQAQQVKNICEGINQEHDLIKCFQVMESFLIDDITNGDVQFVSFLEYEGHIEPRKKTTLKH